MRELAGGRVRRSEAEWRAILVRFEESGLSESVFCQRAKVARGTFVKWRKRLAGQVEPSASFVEWTAPSREEATVPTVLARPKRSERRTVPARDASHTTRSRYDPKQSP